MDATDHPCFRLDALRRYASSLLSASGVAAARASALASQLLWFDAIGAPEFGISTVLALLDDLQAGAVSAKAAEKIGPERAATAVIDGRQGIGALVLARAGGIAVEKARDVGVGVVRVKGIVHPGPSTAVVAEMAVGPVMAVALGPDQAWSVALPSAEGQPVIADSFLCGGNRPAEASSPWGLVLEPGEWLIQAVTVAALEPLSTLHSRVAAADPGRLGWCPAATWEAARLQARERGVPIPKAVIASLAAWADRLGVADRLPSS